MNELELTTEIGAALTAVLKEHGLVPEAVRVRIEPPEIRVLVELPKDKLEK